MFKDHIVGCSPIPPSTPGMQPNKGPVRSFEERPMLACDAVMDAIANYARADTLHVYPTYAPLLERLADYCNVAQDSLLVTNGSDQGIDIAMRAACSAGDEIILATPSFFMYARYARLQNLRISTVPHAKGCRFPTESVLQRVSDSTKLIVITNPGNRTGILVPGEEILGIARRAPHALVLVDECYFEFAMKTVADCVNDYPNIVILRSFSKTWGLASLRIGYMISARQNITELAKVRGPFDVNHVAVVACCAALENQIGLQEYVAEIMTRSKPMLETFLREKDIAFWPSDANFVFMMLDNAQLVCERLGRLGVAAQPMDDPLGNCGLRIGLGTVEQTEQIIDLLNRALDPAKTA